MVNWRENSEQTGTIFLLDLSKAGNSAQACHLVDAFIETLTDTSENVLVDINAGDLLLTRGVLSKIKQQILKSSASLGIMYATVPQTQQAALDEGLFVKEKPTSNASVSFRQPLPLKKENATKPTVSSVNTPSSPATSVDLPDFRQTRVTPANEKPSADFTAVAPQSLEIPELAEAEVETEILSDELMETERLEDGTIDLETTQEVVYTDTALETLYWRQTLRSGQTIRFHGNIIIIGDVHAGSEITAGGDIVVWGELRGIAHAGAQGNYKSEIRAMKIEALQLRIADYIARRPDRIYYHKDGSEVVISPEVARVADGEIKIFKTLLPRA